MGELVSYDERATWRESREHNAQCEHSYVYI